MNEEVMIPKSYHDKVCEEIIRFKDKQFYDAVHLLDDGTLEIHVTDYKMVKRVLVEDDNNFGNFFCEDKADRPQVEWLAVSSYDAFGGSEELWNAHGNPTAFHYCSKCKAQSYVNEFGEELLTDFCPHCGAKMKGADDEVD